MEIKKLNQWGEWCIWFLNPLLVLMAVYSETSKSNDVLLWFGKLHPLVLHFPIVIGIAIVIYFIFFQKNKLEENTEKLILVGNALIAKEFEYKNKLNRSINIKTFLINNKPIKSNYTLKSFYNLLNITSKDSYQSSLFLLNPKKGGFDCYSTGVLGFMPRRHALFAFLKTFSQLNSVKKKNSAISNFNFLLKKDNFIKNKFLIRLSNWWGKITLSPKFKKSKFSIFSKRRKKRIFLNKTNFVFLTKKSSYLTKNIKKINENKKY
jgi:hypothetical protein